MDGDKQDTIPLPSGPSSLCFNKEDFMKDDFDVDKFVMDCRRRVQLETVRDDLHIYLKVLKNAMVELINKDYADFVNLSTNLVGMDRAISNLSTPLSQFKDEVQIVKSTMEETLKKVETKLQERKSLREKRACLQRLTNIIQSVEKIERLLGISNPTVDSSRVSNTFDGDSTGNTSSSELSGQLVERVATEFNKLQFYVNKSRGTSLVEEIGPRIGTITSTLQYNLEGSLLHSLETGDSEQLRQCLRTYATIDKMRDAESLFRQHIVRPYMEDVITEGFINTNPDGLRGMFNKVLQFVPDYCKKLRDVTSGSLTGGEVVRGYDFLVNSVWPEVVSSIESRTPDIFAPGNPNVFYEKYCVSMEFVDQYERNCGSQASVKRLRAHPSFNLFMSKWSLPVYFQIRFQEIAGSLESSLMNPFDKAKNSEFQLHSTNTLYKSLHQCWSEGTYLQPLGHRFWKLNLQLLSRYSTWLEQVKNTQLIPKSKKEQERTTNTLRHNASTGDLPRISSTGSIGDGVIKPREPFQTINVHREADVTMEQLVCLIADAQYLNYKLPSLVDQVVKPNLQDIGHKDMNIINDSVKESQESISRHLPAFSVYIVQELSQQCCLHLKNVGDIPRLYRRTNREVPSKPSTYVSNILKPLTVFLTENKDVIPGDMRLPWIQDVLKTLAEQYLTITSEVLNSVKKMEDSLKRLKRGKSAVTSSGMSDDDKIRLQLSLDVKHFGSQIQGMELSIEDIEVYKQLSDVVDKARTTTHSPLPL